jgi:tetratricopeptide (TPR) repeat protein
MNPPLLRARVLIGQSRWDMAQAELRLALAQDGQNPELHSLLAFCLSHTKDFENAESEARTAVGLAPDRAASHRVLGIVLADRHKYAAAAAAVEQAIALDPSDVETFGTLARVRYAQEDWRGMLDASETGLAIDPEHTRCNNLRAMALIKLGRRAEAGQTLDAALARDPENAFTHANRGWALLESGKQNEALDHFREALTFDPGMKWSRAGIVESLKSKNFVYRRLLQYFLFMSRLSPRARWGIVIGAFVLQRVLVSFAADHPAAAPYCIPLLIIYGLFALLTWLGQPLFNLLLLTDKLGRRALSSDQRWQAVLIGSMLLTAIAMAVGTAMFSISEWKFLGYWTAVGIAAVSLPASAIFVCKAGWPRWTMLVGTALLAIIAVIPLSVWLYIGLWPEVLAAQTNAILWRTSPPLFESVLRFAGDVFVPGIIGSQFLAMWLVRVTPTR